MKKNILLHGATNYGSTNYGDYLYGEIVYDFFRNREYNVIFYQASEFFKKNLIRYDQMKKFKILKTDMMVYIPGGYFGENPNSNLKESIFKFVRYLPVGLKCLLHGIPVVVLAIGASPNENLFLNWGIRTICSKSKLVTTRDSTSYASLKRLCGNKGNIVEAGDLIITVNWDEKKKITNKIEKLIKKIKDKKLLLIHYNHSEKALNLFAKCVSAFLNTYPNYQTVIVSDTILENEKELYAQFEQKCGVSVSLFKYEDPAEMTALLSIADMIWTSKLHVGVVACTLGKSVAVAACHYEKTRRFYEQINQAERCLDLDRISEMDFLETVENYEGIGVDVEDSIRQLADITWTMLEEIQKEDIIY